MTSFPALQSNQNTLKHKPPKKTKLSSESVLNHRIPSTTQTRDTSHRACTSNSASPPPHCIYLRARSNERDGTLFNPFTTSSIVHSHSHFHTREENIHSSLSLLEFLHSGCILYTYTAIRCCRYAKFRKIEVRSLPLSPHAPSIMPRGWWTRSACSA